MVAVIREGQRYDVEDVRFWEIAKNGELRCDDQILCTDGNWRPAHQVSDVKPFVPNPPSSPLEDLLIALAVGALAGLAIGGAAALVSELLRDEPKRKRRRPNTEPLPEWKKQQVREGDAYQCVYCGVFVERGHIDHRNPRTNGGSNNMPNLSLACSDCNLAKGTMTATEFRRRLDKRG
ncbi:MAG: HNH endonuclease [Planctomycetota bacterium]|nr:HNH endonuclease [Planctomycetota bacterium]